MFEGVQIVLTAVLMTLGCWLFTRRLPQREGFRWRVALLAAALATCVAAAILAGFSLHPPLSDNRSFFVASAGFLAILALATGAVWWAYGAPLLTAAFCASSAYNLQNLVFSLDRTAHVLGLVPGGNGDVVPMVVLLCVAGTIVYGLSYRLFLRDLTARGLLQIDDRRAMAVIVLAILFNIFFDLTIGDLNVYDEIPHRYLAILSLGHLTICVVLLYGEFELLYNRRLRESVATMQDVIDQSVRQYQTAQATMDAVNARVHVIRHAVARSLVAEGSVDGEALADVVRQISVYDTTVRTGNPTLDAVLSEKSLLCHQRGMALTCIADGHTLDFLPAADVYALVGTTLACAMEVAAAGLDGGSVTLVLKQALGMTSLHVEAVPAGSTAAAHWGAEGLRAARLVAERYGGSLTTDLGDDSAKLDVLLPAPAA